MHEVEGIISSWRFHNGKEQHAWIRRFFFSSRIARCEEVKKVLSAPSSTPLCGRQSMRTAGGGRGLARFFARFFKRALGLVLQVCRTAQGGQHSEPGHQLQGKGFVDAERCRDTWRSLLRPI